jgi:hypothetical protein
MAELKNPTLSKQQASIFADKWKSFTDEQQYARRFWSEFFQTLCGVDDEEIAGIEYEKKVKSTLSGNLERIDVYWKNVALIEHKSTGENLDKAELQARGYLKSLPPGYRPRTIIISDFANFRIIDEKLNRTHQFTLVELPNNIHRFESIILGSRPHALEDEIIVDQEAAKLMANLYIELESSGYEGHETSIFLIRLLFLMFGDDTRMWEHNLVKKIILDSKEDGSDIGKKFNTLFKVLNTPTEKRAKNLETQFTPFPYVNGGIFAEDIAEIDFNRRMRIALIHVANYDWANINPTIFGAMFQMIKSKEERGELGEHYTSEENINKIVYPLFLEDLQDRLARAWDNKKALKELRKDLSKIKIFDPACGCGNFLVVSFRHLRQLELELTVRLQNLEGKESDIGLDGTMGLSIGLHQFYGIEILEWPAQVARMALFLTDHQENLKFEQITGVAPNRFPLTESAVIVNANALRTDWNTICPMSENTFILGNPPFIGARLQNEEQKADTEQVWKGVKGVGELDSVANWYKQASVQISSNGGQASFVSTNSIAQGVQPAIIWEDLYGLGMHINFAHQTFKWSNDAPGQAAVHVVIIGFSKVKAKDGCKLWQYDDLKGAPVLKLVSNINAYLVDAPDLLIKTRTMPLSKSTPKMLYGSQPNDGGFLSDISAEEASQIRKNDSIAARYLRQIVGARELIHGIERWCLWLVDASPAEIRSSKVISKRVGNVRTQRSASSRLATRELASTSHLFGFISQPETPYVAVPRHSSEDRSYVPMAYFEPNVVTNDAVSIIPDAPLWIFGLLQSRPFNVWNKAVSGRIKSDTRISNTLTYNNFPFTELTKAQRTSISLCAQDVLDARETYPGSNLADLYGSTSMPAALINAHAKLDEQVLLTYGLAKNVTDTEVLEALFKMYEELTRVKI